MALKLENINNLIADDLAKRNENWTEIDNTFALKADKATTYTKTEVDTSLGLKANKQQEAWIVPTLLNGTTGTIRYRKNESNQLEIVGKIKVVSSTYGAVSLFTIPQSYIPTRYAEHGHMQKFNCETAKLGEAKMGVFALSRYDKDFRIYFPNGDTEFYINLVIPLD